MSLDKIIFIFVVLIAFVMAIVLLGINERKKTKEKYKKQIDHRYGKKANSNISEGRINILSGYYKRHLNDNSIDDITWDDLSLDKIYGIINNTYSSAGEEYLYYMLRNPSFEINELENRDKDINYFSNNTKNAKDILYITKNIGKLEKYSLYDYLEIDDALLDKCSDRIHIIALICLIISVCMLFIKTGLGIILTLLIIFFNIGVYFNKKSTIYGYLISLKYIMRLYNAAKQITINKEQFFSNVACEREIKNLEDAVEKLKLFSRNSRYVFSSMSDTGNVFDLFMSYINMILHIDLIMFNHMIKNLSKNKDKVDDIVTNIGYIESIIAISSFRESLKDEWCKPTFKVKSEESFDVSSEVKSNEMIINAENAYHPLINKPVKNSYKLDKCMLITGSNASGKSTFLKTIAINQILSQTIYTTLADAYETQFFRIYSSMSLRDDIIKGDSYFMAEIKALKRILLANSVNSNNNIPILCFVDEVLRGTNTVERIAASTEVLKYFSDNNILCCAATHDIELTELLENIYTNYHFKEDFKDGDVIFSYKLLDGKAESRNAIRLLETIGYDKSIVDRATMMADQFIKTNKWRNV